jgi:phage-related protein
MDGGTATVVMAIPPAGGTFTYTETLTAAAHSAVFRLWDLFGGYSATETEAFTTVEASVSGKGWLKWNGANSLDYNIIVLDQPEPTKPAERITYEKVLGRAGYVYINEEEDVYDTLEKTATVYVQDFDAVRGWLKGEGTVEFGNEPGYFYNAYISDVITFKAIVRGRIQKKAEVTFICQPFKFLTDEVAQIYTISGAYLSNIGNVQSKPLITIYGTGDISLTIGDETMTLNGVVESITIDCLEMIAVDEDGNDYTALTGDFFKIPVGTSQITWTGNVTSVSILPRWGYV